MQILYTKNENFFLLQINYLQAHTKKTPTKALILYENFGGFRGFSQKTHTRKVREKYAEFTLKLRENHQPPVHDVSLVHCIVADSVTVVR